MNNLKLFVWTDVLCDWSCGIAFALAENLTEARNLVKEKYKEDGYTWKQAFEEIDEKKPKVFEKPVGFYLNPRG